MASQFLSKGDILLHQFPDNETYVKILSPIKNADVILYATLSQPNQKILPLIFSASTARLLGAKSVGLIAPYLPYMRQDTVFEFGEGVTSRYFANLISKNFDWLITVDPHLHRYKTLHEIYSIPTYVLSANDLISQWIRLNLHRPGIFGPDAESHPLISSISEKLNVPYFNAKKIRLDDNQVILSLPTIEGSFSFAVIIDDIISTGGTVIQLIKFLQQTITQPIVVIAVHPLFANDAYNKIISCGIRELVSCNSIPHLSNKIDLSPLILNSISSLL